MARTLFSINIASVIGLDSDLAVGIPLYFYEQDGVTEAVTFTTAEGSTENANPMLTQGDGRFAQQAWIEPGNYVYVLGEPEDPLFTGQFVASATPETFDPALDGFLQGDEPLPVEHGGTGSTSAPDALIELGALPLAGGTVSGNIVRATKGVHLYWNTAAMNNGAAFLTPEGDPDPTSAPGQIWYRYS